MIKLPLAVSIAETMEAASEADVKQVAERLQRDHPEADCSSEEIAEVLEDARKEEASGRSGPPSAPNHNALNRRART